MFSSSADVSRDRKWRPGGVWRRARNPAEKPCRDEAEVNQRTGPGLRLRAAQLAATNMNWAVTMGDPVANSGQAVGRSGLFSGLLGEEPGPWDIIPVLGSHQGQVGHRGGQK